LIVNLADKDALRSYLDHPTRMRYVRERLQPLEEQRIDITLARDPTVRDWDRGRVGRDGAPTK
jgi:hypothetical protein